MDRKELIEGVQAGGAEPCHHANCERCRGTRDFEMPPQFMSELTADRVVVFAGAGVSTEGLSAHYRFYSEVASELGLDPAAAGAFP